jgi:thiamine biosynthesis lipoprotein
LLLRASQQMSELTDGLYNPFVLPAVQRAGYLQSAAPGYEDDTVEDYRNRTVVPAHALTITGDKITIPYGSALDMGGCGKGYLADKLADVLDAYQLQGYWVSLSGDMVTFGTDEDGEPWQTTIASASTASSDNARIIGSGERLHIATSGTFKRTNQVTGNWHHLIDPRSGISASTDICLATVVAQSAIEADVLASCAVITGSTEAESFLLQRGASAGYLQTLDRSFGFGDVLQKTQSERQTINAW